MRIRTLVLSAFGALTLGGGLLFAALDKETRGLLAALPTDRDVLSWKQSQRDAAFRAMDRLPILAKAARVTPSPSPLELPAGEPLEIPGLDAYLADQRTAGLVILQDGKVRVERYGLDFDAKGRWTSFSVAKSFTSTLVGAAIHDGFIKSLEDTVSRYIPDLRGSVYDGVTIRQLLTMSSGVRWNEDYEDPNADVAQFNNAKPAEGMDATVSYMRSLARTHPAGTVWHYNTGETNLIGILVSQATSKPLAQYLQEKIWHPAGMEGEATWLLGKTGHEIAGCCMQAATRDFARFGLFVLANGRVGGGQLVPTGWFAEATRKQMDIGVPGRGYGFQWWTYDDGAVAAQGIFGQGIYIDPARRLVIASHANWPRASLGPQSAAREQFYAQVRALIDAETAETSFLISGAQVADGTGGPLVSASVRVVGDSIAEVGSLTPLRDEIVVDGLGLVLAPGFIDIHNHSTVGLEREREATTQVSQGITTLAVGQDGSSPWPLRAYLDRLRANPPAVNVITFVGHATIRRAVMGDDYLRSARPAEIAQMTALITQAMEEGAFGLSSGLEYEVGSYAATEEIIAMARAAGTRGGLYISHIRDEGNRAMAAIGEAIAIGERGGLPVQITHLKLGTASVWGRAGEVVAMITAAQRRGVDVSADVYPYLAWQSTPRVLIPNRQYTDSISIQRGLDDIGGARNVQITRWAGHDGLVGQRLDAAAQVLGVTAVEAYRRFQADDDAGMIGHAMIDNDLRRFLTQRWVMVASDGGIANNHPRGAGTFPRVLGRYVRERQWLSIGEAVHKMTAQPATRLGLRDRGRIAPGMKADLVLFDPATVTDRSTFESPRALASGITRVWVNGIEVWNGAAPTATSAGRVLALP